MHPSRQLTTRCHLLVASYDEEDEHPSLTMHRYVAHTSLMHYTALPPPHHHHSSRTCFCRWPKTPDSPCCSLGRCKFFRLQARRFFFFPPEDIRTSSHNHGWNERWRIGGIPGGAQTGEHHEPTLTCSCVCSCVCPFVDRPCHESRSCAISAILHIYVHVLYLRSIAHHHYHHRPTHTCFFRATGRHTLSSRRNQTMKSYRFWRQILR
jgi:hypothetical protein